MRRRQFLGKSLLVMTLVVLLSCDSEPLGLNASGGWIIFDLGAEGAARAINEHGIMVGALDTPELRPFVRAGGLFVRIQDKPGWAFDVDNGGRVVGFIHDPEPVGFLWESGHLTELDFVPMAINEPGQIVGYRNVQEGDEYLRRAVLWDDGIETDLGSLGGFWTQANDINEHGWIVGESTNEVGHFRAFLWRNGQMMDLGTLGGAVAVALGINDRGQIVGASTTAQSAGLRRPFLWESGIMVELPIIHEGQFGGAGAAEEINESGQIVGSTVSIELDEGEERAALWENGEVSDLGTLPGHVMSHAADINEAGEIVGSSTQSFSGGNRVVMWTRPPSP